jgi:DNA topoisomerase-1
LININVISFLAKSEERKNRSKEEKQQLKAENEEIVKQFGWCIIDGHKQRIGNFKIEPPGIYRKNW